MAYGLWNGKVYTASEQIIGMLDASVPLQAAHIQAVRNLERQGMRYSNEDCDVLGTAWQCATNKKTEVPSYAQGWVNAMLAQAKEAA
jgi:hypothetical protein